MSTIKPDQLAETIKKVLDEYRGVTEEAASTGAMVTARHAVEKLRNAKPAGSEEWGSWSKYNNSWDVTDLAKRKNVYGQVVHNKRHYQLTHLLEFGHALWQGGRTRAFEHIAPVAQEAEEELIRNIKQQLNNS